MSKVKTQNKLQYIKANLMYQLGFLTKSSARQLCYRNPSTKGLNGFIDLIISKLSERDNQYLMDLIIKVNDIKKYRDDMV